MKKLQENLKIVEEKVTAACKRAGRERSEVTLIAVSKTKPISMLEEILETGTVDFGENKVQEMQWKHEQMPKNIKWHMIGHLQRNKVKQIVPFVHLIHSVDSLRLAQTIDEEAKKQNRVIDILVQVNAAEEETKFGVRLNEALPLIEEAAKLENIRVKGLMTIAPFVENPEENRKYFKYLKQLSVDIMAKSIDNVTMDRLSMGMTGDYEVAIEEGATLVRVGTGIFGEREYK